MDVLSQLNYIKHCEGIKRRYDLETKIRDHKNEVLNALRNGKALRLKRVYNSRWFGLFKLGNDKKLNYFLYHYQTPILKIEIDERRPSILEGIWGSVSDVQGVNKCLKAFNLPYRYSSIKGLQKLNY